MWRLRLRMFGEEWMNECVKLNLRYIPDWRYRELCLEWSRQERRRVREEVCSDANVKS
jgi:hypothetical protein